MSRTRQPRAEKARTIRLIRPLTLDGVGIICLTMGESASIYTLCEIPCEIGGRGFSVARLGLGSLYHVRIDPPDETSCECLGFLRHGYCKHVLGLTALIQAEKI